jgi:tetratricopeptide (TPR) repeat protein
VDRRGFLIATSSALAASMAQWATASPADAAGISEHGRRIGVQTCAYFDTRLEALRHLDDVVGASQVYDAALLELRLLTTLLKDATYSADVGCRLYGCAAEAARLAGWCAYDAGRHADSERLFLTSLRAAGSADDAMLGASTLAFWANLRYNAGDPRGALDLVDGALDERRKLDSPRLVAMLHARAARAHSKAGEATAAWRAVERAFAAYDSAPPPREDMVSPYWVNHGGLHQAAASSALSLGEPKRALEHFVAARTHADP